MNMNLMLVFIGIIGLYLSVYIGGNTQTDCITLVWMYQYIYFVLAFILSGGSGVRKGNNMKIHYKRKYAGLMIFTKCGLLFWQEVNNYHTYDVVVSDKKKVTCKNCLKIINKEK